MAAPAPATRRAGGWAGTLAALAAGALIASSLVGGIGEGLGGKDVSLRDPLLFGSGLVLLVMVFRRRHAARTQPRHATPGGPGHREAPSARPTMGDHPSGGSDLDRGIRDIRQTDPGFDPARFAGYTGMVFRDAQSAWMTRDIGSLRDRVTPGLYGELQTHCERLRSVRHSNRVEEIEIQSEITEAWQEDGRDYVTAYVRGSMVDYTVDEVSDSLMDGSRTIPKRVEEFWTFTRPAGLNFWMLSAIQTS